MSEKTILKIIKENIDPEFEAWEFQHWQEILQVVRPDNIKAWEKGFLISYYRLLDKVLTGSFDWWEDFMFELEKNQNWIKWFKLWLDSRKKKCSEFITSYMQNKEQMKERIFDRYIEYKKLKWERNDDVSKKFHVIQTTDNKEIWLLSLQKVFWDMLDLEYNSPEIRKMFENMARCDDDVYKSYDQMIESMGKELLATKQIVLNSCMMTIGWYYNSLKKRLEKWENIPYYEMKHAYEVLKTEIKEPTKIKEIRSKNISININMPLTESKIAEIMKNTNNVDTSIEIADNFKHLLPSDDTWATS